MTFDLVDTILLCMLSLMVIVNCYVTCQTNSVVSRCFTEIQSFTDLTMAGYNRERGIKEEKIKVVCDLREAENELDSLEKKYEDLKTKYDNLRDYAISAGLITLKKVIKKKEM